MPEEFCTATITAGGVSIFTIRGRELATPLFTIRVARPGARFGGIRRLIWVDEL